MTNNQRDFKDSQGLDNQKKAKTGFEREWAIMDQIQGKM